MTKYFIGWPTSSEAGIKEIKYIKLHWLSFLVFRPGRFNPFIQIDPCNTTTGREVKFTS